MTFDTGRGWLVKREDCFEIILYLYSFDFIYFLLISSNYHFQFES